MGPHIARWIRPGYASLKPDPAMNTYMHLVFVTSIWAGVGQFLLGHLEKGGGLLGQCLGSTHFNCGLKFSDVRSSYRYSAARAQVGLDFGCFLGSKR